MLALILHGIGENVMPARHGRFAADVHRGDGREGFVSSSRRVGVLQLRRHGRSANDRKRCRKNPVTTASR